MTAKFKSRLKNLMELYGRVGIGVYVALMVVTYLGAFFDQFLRGRAQPLLRGPSPRHPEVVFTR